MDIAALTSTTTQSASATASSQLSQNFDTFLTLLTTQLRNQDPLKPLDTEKFTEQLVQFANVEQSIKTNQHLEALLALQASSANETALSMVGRIATVESDTAALTSDAAQWTYTLPQNAAALTAKVYDMSGALVAVLTGPASAGAHQLNWNGAMNNGGKATPGLYRIDVEAVDAEGSPIAAEVAARGRVSGVSFGNAGPEIEIAGQKYALALVSRVDEDF